MDRIVNILIAVLFTVATGYTPKTSQTMSTDTQAASPTESFIRNLQLSALDKEKCPKKTHLKA